MLFPNCTECGGHNRSKEVYNKPYVLVDSNQMKFLLSQTNIESVVESLNGLSILEKTIKPAGPKRLWKCICVEE